MRNLFSVVACLILASCQQESKEPSLKADSATGAGYAAADTTAVANEAITYLAAPASALRTVPPASVEQKIIREANLSFETPDMAATYGRAMAAVKKYGAQVQNDAESKSDETISRNMTIRVPADKFDAFLAEVCEGISYFDRKEISAQDVTEEYIDTDARLKTKKKLEERYLQLLSKAAKVSDMLEIEEKLSAVREDIEAKEGQLRYMQTRVAMSTVHLEFYKQVATEGGVRVSYGSKMWNAVKSGFNGISSFFLGLLNMWPIILILVVLIFWLRRRVRKRKNP